MYSCWRLVLSAALATCKAARARSNSSSADLRAPVSADDECLRCARLYFKLASAYSSAASSAASLAFWRRVRCSSTITDARRPTSCSVLCSAAIWPHETLAPRSAATRVRRLATTRKPTCTSWARGHAACSSKLRRPLVGSATKAAAVPAEAIRRAARASATKASNEARASRSTDGVSSSLRALGAGSWPASPSTAVVGTAVVAVSAVASARRHAAVSSEAVAQRLARMSA